MTIRTVRAMNCMKTNEFSDLDDTPEKTPRYSINTCEGASFDNLLVVDEIQGTTVDVITATHFDKGHHSGR